MDLPAAAELQALSAILELDSWPHFRPANISGDKQFSGTEPSHNVGKDLYLVV